MSKIEEHFDIKRKHGLHARPATLFVQLANKFDSSVRLEKNGEVVDGKSIIALLSLGGNKGAKIKLIVEGEDSSEAMDELKSFLEEDDD